MTNDLAYTQKVEQAAQRPTNEALQLCFSDIEQLKAKLANRDERIAKLKADSDFDHSEYKRLRDELQAKMAMQAEILTELRNALRDTYEASPEGRAYLVKIDSSINATQPTVDAFMAKKKAEWERGVLEQLADYADEAHFRTLPSSEIRRIAEERGGMR